MLQNMASRHFTVDELTSKVKFQKNSKFLSQLKYTRTIERCNFSDPLKFELLK